MKLSQQAKNRIEIAKDVLKHLKVMNVKQGSYVRSIGIKNDMLPKDLSDSKAVACSLIKNKCQVCAKGALFLLKVAKFNSYDISKELKDTVFDYSINMFEESIIEGLKDTFSEHQLDVIEAAFEGKAFCNKFITNTECVYDFYPDYGLYFRLKDFHKKYGTGNKNAKNRLKAIMQNIIKNHGTFIP